MRASWLFRLGCVALTLVGIAVGCGLDIASTVTDTSDASFEDGATRVDGGIMLPDGNVIPITDDDGGGGGEDAPAVTTTCTLDGGAVGAKCGDTCVDLTRDHANCGKCSSACPTALFTCESSTCVDVATALTPLRVELPCVGSGPGNYCRTGTVTKMSPTPARLLGGTAGTTYTLTLVVRGVAEEKTYSNVAKGNAVGDAGAALFAVNGTADTSNWNDYTLLVGDPLVSYRLNAGHSNNDYCDELDYVATITIKGGASLVLRAISQDDNSAENRLDNGNTIIPPVVPPYPKAFDGQFVQIDIVNVSVSP